MGLKIEKQHALRCLAQHFVFLLRRLQRSPPMECAPHFSAYHSPANLCPPQSCESRESRALRPPRCCSTAHGTLAPSGQASAWRSWATRSRSLAASARARATDHRRNPSPPKAVRRPCMPSARGRALAAAAAQRPSEAQRDGRNSAPRVSAAAAARARASTPHSRPWPRQLPPAATALRLKRAT